jgi:hypothetical protein
MPPRKEAPAFGQKLPAFAEEAAGKRNASVFAPTWRHSGKTACRGVAMLGGGRGRASGFKGI